MWKTEKSFDIRDLGSNMVLILFDEEYDLNHILMRGPWSFDKWMLLQRGTVGVDVSAFVLTLILVKLYVKVSRLLSHDERDCKLWVRSKGTLQKEDQQYGVWLKANLERPQQHSVIAPQMPVSREPIIQEASTNVAATTTDQALNIPPQNQPLPSTNTLSLAGQELLTTGMPKPDMETLNSAKQFHVKPPQFTTAKTDMEVAKTSDKVKVVRPSHGPAITAPTMKTQLKGTSTRKGSAQRITTPMETDISRLGSRINSGCYATSSGPMSTISWNYRELRNPCTVHALKRALQKEAPQFIFLMETKLSQEAMKYKQQELEYTQGLAVSSHGQSGGLALLWKPDSKVAVQGFSC
uniref:DUF4283 domain-containing protein n=1 Tax=Quercus lobata TaxID=97700 RepID=A0A7N2MKR5_QUELO